MGHLWKPFNFCMILSVSQIQYLLEHNNFLHWIKYKNDGNTFSEHFFLNTSCHFSRESEFQLPIRGGTVKGVESSLVWGMHFHSTFTYKGLHPVDCRLLSVLKIVGGRSYIRLQNLDRAPADPFKSYPLMGDSPIVQEGHNKTHLPRDGGL